MKYLIIGGLVSAPGGAFYQGTEVEAGDFGIPQSRIAHLVEQGVIEEVAAAQVQESPPVSTPITPPQLPPPATTDPLVLAVGNAGIAARLREANLGTPEQIRDATDERIRAVGDIGEARLAKLRQYAATPTE